MELYNRFLCFYVSSIQTEQVLSLTFPLFGSIIIGVSERNKIMIENRHTRVDYLLETTGFDQGDLLHEIIRAMSDQEFDDIYQFICRMHDIEPDESNMDKFVS